ncbi:MAG TPA: BON domain-containing protein [Ktedonobacterales bacterium]
MNDAIELAPVLKLRMGAPVTSSDGELGKLTAVLIDSATHTLTGIQARFGGLGGLMGADVTVPAKQIREAGTDMVRLSEELPALRAMKADVAGVSISHATTVAANGKSFGRVGHLTFTHETGALRHVIVSRGLGEDIVLPATTLTAVSEHQLVCAMPQRGLTPYRPDEELEADIRERLEAIPQLFVDVPGIEVRAIDGNVWMRGNVSSEITERRVKTVLSEVRGIDQLIFEIVPDTQLAAYISTALASDPRTAGQPIGVYPRLGEVALRGRVRTEAAQQAASDVAARVPGVRSVANGLLVDSRAYGVPELAGVTNDEDIVPGGR